MIRSYDVGLWMARTAVEMLCSDEVICSARLMGRNLDCLIVFIMLMWL